MRYFVLGSLELRSDDDAPIALTGPKRRALLALLVQNAGSVMSGPRLADDLWGDSPPRSWPTTLQTFVYQLRRRYGVEDLVTTPAGYVLEAAPEAIDAARFEQLLREARRCVVQGPDAALPLLDDALALWRGDAYEDVQFEPWAVAETARLEQLRLEAIELWAACCIGVRHFAAAAAELEVWTRRHRLRESLWALRLVALAESGRNPEALRAATELRAVLRDELGTDPGAACTDIENRILRDESLPPWNELAAIVLAPAPARPRRKALRSPVERLAPTASRAPEADRLVGRTDELAALRAAFDAASRGEPQAVLITGPAGIGKSRLLNEFTPGAVSAGALLVWGACQEDAAVPYLPIATAFAALGGDDNPFGVRAVERGLGADDGARLALYIAVTRALLEAGRDRLVVLAVEDLHWADDATIGLLRHLLAVGSEDAARERSQFMLVVTTRPPEAGTPADGLVGRLRRASRAHFVDLAPLAPDDVRDLASNWLEIRPPPPVVDALRTAAGGNPLVLRSILGRMRDTGGDGASEMQLRVGPTDLDHELWRRFERVGEDARMLLTYAAVLGDGSTLASLQRVAGIPRAVVDECIAEAAEQGVVYADDERYWFEHPQLRQLIYYATSDDERAVCHLDVADRLGRGDEDILVVAHHLARAGARSDPSRTRDAARDAADRAASIGAWRVALTHGQVALDAAERSHAEPEELAELSLKTGRAALLARDRDLAVRYLTAAADLAESCGSLATWGAAAVHLARESVEDREAYASATIALARVDRFLGAAGDAEPALRARAHALEAEIYSDRDLSAASEHAELAERIASAIDDDDVRARVTFARGVRHMMGVEFDGALECFKRARSAGASLSDPNPRNWAAARAGVVAYVLGDPSTAEQVLADAYIAAHEADNEADCSFIAAMSASVAVVRGHFARCEEEGERARRAYARAPYWFTPGALYPTLVCAAACRGEVARADALLAEWETVQPRVGRRYRPLVDALSGDVGAARAVLESNPFRIMTGSRADLTASGPLAAQALLGSSVRAPSLVEGPLEVLTSFYERGMRFTVGWPALVPRVLALSYDTLGADADARRWFERGLNDALGCSATAEVAATARDYGRFLAARGDANADDMLALARRMASGEFSGSVAERAVLVTDLVASTALNNRLGDREYVALLREHDIVIRRALARYDGVEFKHTGDGIAAWFFSPHAALECACAVREEFAQRSARSRPLLQIKVALSTGEPMVVDGDLRGLSVTMAFRALERAHAGEVLATGDFVERVRDNPQTFEARGRRRLKGFPSPINLFAVSRSESNA